VKHKATLVAKGYVQKKGVDFDEVFAPVARLETETYVINGDANFELKPALITIVHATLICGKAHEDVNAHLQHFLKIYSTFRE
jgi:hypothetical protein